MRLPCRDSGTETEMSKIKKGYADIMFYGHAKTESPPTIGLYYVLDCNVLREILWGKQRGNFKWSEKKNGDGTSFICFDLRTMVDVDRLVIASNDKPKYDPSIRF